MEVQAPDTFLSSLHDAVPDGVKTALQRMARRFRRTSMSIREIAAALTLVAPTFAKKLT